jgi:hypothetical protein
VPANLLQGLASATSGLVSVLAALSGSAAPPVGPASVLPATGAPVVIPVKDSSYSAQSVWGPASCASLSTSLTPAASALARPMVVPAVSASALPSVPGSVSLPSVISSEEENDDFPTYQQDESEAEPAAAEPLSQAAVLTYIQALCPNAIVDNPSITGGAGSFTASALPTHQSEACPCLVKESPLIGLSLDAALAQVRRESGVVSQESESALPDYPSALKAGVFLRCPARKGVFKKSFSFDRLPATGLSLSHRDRLLLRPGAAPPTELRLSWKSGLQMQALLARALEQVSLMDVVSASVGRAVALMANPPLSESAVDPLSAAQDLMGVLSEVIESLSAVLSSSYVNVILALRDSVLASSAQPAHAKTALRAGDLSSSAVFGPAAKAASEELSKRTTEQAFAAFARQGTKRPSEPSRFSSPAAKAAKGASSRFRFSQSGRGRGSSFQSRPFSPKPSSSRPRASSRGSTRDLVRSRRGSHPQ